MGWIRQGGEYVGGPSEHMGPAPQFDRSELRKLGLKRGVWSQLKQQYSITLRGPLRFSCELIEGCL